MHLNNGGKVLILNSHGRFILKKEKKIKIGGKIFGIHKRYLFVLTKCKGKTVNGKKLLTNVRNNSDSGTHLGCFGQYLTIAGLMIYFVIIYVIINMK